MFKLPGPNTSATLKTAARSADGLGGFTEVWNTTETFDCVITPLSGRERVKYGKESYQALAKALVPAHKGNGTVRTVTVAQQLVVGSQTYNIVAVENPMSGNFFLRLILEEVANV